MIIMEPMPDIPAFLDRRPPLSGAYGKFGPELKRLGYDTTPVLGKKPKLTAWPTRPPNALEFGKHSNCNLGVLCGGLHNLVAIDIDVLDQACANELEKLMTEELGYAPKRVGKAPKLLLIYRCTESREKKQTAEYLIDGEKAQVEFLGEGQQFVASGIHPDTKQPYRWPGDRLIDLPPIELTEVSPAQLDAVREMADSILAVYGAPKGQTKSHGATKLNLGLPIKNSDRIQKIKNGEAWHLPMVELTGSLVQKGLDRETIIELCMPLRWDGFTEGETRAELSKMVDGAFNKNYAPLPKPEDRPRSRSLASVFSEIIDVPEPPHPWLPRRVLVDGWSPESG